jgi:hypothetical protein
LNSIQKHIENELAANFPRGGPEIEALKIIKAVFLNGFLDFLHLFKKCAHKIRETKSVLLYQQDLNGYKGVLEDERLNEAAKDLIKVTTEFSKSKTGYFVMHFDELQQWAVSEWFTREDKRHVAPEDFRKYYLLGLSDAMLAFKGTNIRFVISGTNIEQGRVLRISSQVKTKTLYLPLFSEEAFIELLERFFNIGHLDREELRTKIAAPLAGCARSCEYFFTQVKKTFQNLSPNEVTVDALVSVNGCSFAANALIEGKRSLRYVV